MPNEKAPTPTDTWSDDEWKKAAASALAMQEAAKTPAGYKDVPTYTLPREKWPADFDPNSAAAGLHMTRIPINPPVQMEEMVIKAHKPKPVMQQKMDPVKAMLDMAKQAFAQPAATGPGLHEVMKKSQQ